MVVTELKGGSPDGFTVQELGAALTVMQPAFRKIFENLAATHNNEHGKWFDDLEEELIRDAKGTVTEGIAIETDAHIVKFAVDFLQLTLNSCRRSLVVKD